MAMMPGLFTISALAVELQRDRRTLAAALRDVPCDGHVAGRCGWRIASVLSVLGQSNRTARGHFEGAARDLEEIERLALALEEGLQRMRSQKPGARRKTAEQIAPLIGEFDRLLTRTHSVMPLSERMFVARATDEMVRGAVAYLLYLCGWKVVA